MATDRLGGTVMELFAYNPYRVLGVAVDSTQEQIDETYKKLLAMCEDGTINTYKSPFDFPSLPPFQRNSDSLPAAYSKLEGDVYKCFAFSESLYAVSLSQADIAIQISNIDSYDKFLSCYMWLIINDKNLFQKNLWFKIAKHIDLLICSTPDQWATLFDHRFPKPVYENDMDSLKGFYNTFCEIILFPLKEMVRGSMECATASEVLSIALFDGDVSTFMSELENADKKQKKTSGRKTPAMPEVSLLVPPDLDTPKPSEAADKEETHSVDLLEGVEEENIYTEALNRMIESNRARNQVIKSVDTTKVFGNGNLGKEEDVELTMDSVNSKNFDSSRLDSPYEIDPAKEEKKVYNVDISDMLNPQLEGRASSEMRESFSGNMDFTNKEKGLKRNKFLLKFVVFLIIVAICATIGYTFREEIWDVVGPIIEKVIDAVKDFFKSGSR